MTRHVLAVTGLLVGLLGSSPAQTAGRGGLPASLDRYYPPAAPKPEYLFRMAGMGNALTGIIVNLTESDLPNVKAQYDRFNAQYRELRTLVPEWRNRFPLKPVDELGAALRGGDQGKIMAAMKNVGQTCNSCHVETMVGVQQKYHWPDFRPVAVHDPLSGKGMEFAELMHALDMGLTGVGVNLEEGQRENAQKQYQGFRTRFAALKETCVQCHDSERRYFVDGDVQAMVDTLGSLLEAPAPDRKRVEGLAAGIGTESCFRCHLVHVPAAFSKVRSQVGAR
jgi:hypothetical protein